MEKKNKQNDINLENAARQIVDWQKQDKKNRSYILLTCEHVSGECIISEGGIGRNIINMLAQAMDTEEDINRQIKLAQLLSAAHGILGDNE